jgi:hypothetical protein
MESFLLHVPIINTNLRFPFSMYATVLCVFVRVKFLTDVFILGIVILFADVSEHSVLS